MADQPEMQDRPSDPYVRERLAAGGAGTGPGQSLAGLWGDSDRAGFRRLYLTTRLDYFVEFRVDQVVAVDAVPPDAPPFLGLDATRVTVAPEATLDWVRRQVGGADPFLLDAREATVQPPDLTTWGADCPGVTVGFGQSDFLECDTGRGGHRGGTFGPWPTQGGHTCATCNEDTCATCDQTTCVTCGRATCATCEGQRCQSLAGTCATYETYRGCTEETCANCGVWGGSGGATCESTCVSCRGTCDVSCAGTCRQTCDATCAATCQATCENTCFTCAGSCQATCDTCWTCPPSCGHCQTSPGWCPLRV